MRRQRIFTVLAKASVKAQIWNVHLVNLIRGGGGGLMFVGQDIKSDSVVGLLIGNIERTKRITGPTAFIFALTFRFVKYQPYYRQRH